MHQFSANETQKLQSLEEFSSSIKVSPSPRYHRVSGRDVCRAVYIPIELSGRELYGKARLAGELYRQGFQVILGATWNICCNKFTDMPPGIVLLKTLNALDNEKMREAQEAGHRIVVIDEEMFSLRPKVDWYRAMTNENALHLADMICAPGIRSKEAFEQITDTIVVNTGSPRCDIPAITSGEDILVCSMAGMVNSKKPWRDSVIRRCEIYDKPLEGEFLDYLREKVVHEWACLSLLLETLQELSKRFPNRRIRLRVHPAENLLNYNVGGNITFDSSPSFFESSNGTGVLVYVSGCSTGIESFFAKIPSVRLSSGGHGLSHDLHIGANTATEAADAVDQQFKSPRILGDLDEHYSPMSLVEHIDSLHRSNANSREMDVESVWRKRKQEVLSQPLLATKFPDTAPEYIESLTGTRAKTIGWNTWLLN